MKIKEKKNHLKKDWDAEVNQDNKAAILFQVLEKEIFHGDEQVTVHMHKKLSYIKEFNSSKT